MSERLLIGGFASSEAQVTQTAQHLSQHFNEDVEAMNFRTALAQSRAVFDERKIITHSGGILAVAKSHPQELIAVAPPVPEHQAMLVWRGWVMGRKLRQAEEAESSFKDTSYYEVLRYGHANFGALPGISRHNAFTTAKNIALQGASTTVVLMDQDGIFNYHSDEAIEAAWSAQAHGVDIRHITGEHVRFTNETAQVMSEIAIAQTFRSYECHVPCATRRLNPVAG